MDQNQNNRSRGGNSRRGMGNNNRQPHNNFNREFYRTGDLQMDAMNKPLGFKSVSTWKQIRKRLEELYAEKSACHSELQKREEEATKSHNSRHSILLKSERESIREKAKDRESLKLKEEEFKTEHQNKLALIEQLNSEDTTEATRVVEIMKELADKEEQLRLEKDRILESFMVLETQFTTQEKKLTKEISEERETLNREKSELMSKFASREKNLDLEIQRFCLEVERQASELDKRSRFDREPVMIRNKLLEREIVQRDQAMQHLHSYIGDLEERTQMQMEQIQRLDSECHYQKTQLLQQLEHEKSTIIAKAKADGVMEYMSGEWNEVDDGVHSYTAQHDPLSHDITTQSSAFGFSSSYPAQDVFVQPSHSHSSQSPCFQSLKPSNGAVLTDLRDRYEDIKAVQASAENNTEKLNGTLKMIRKIVSYYESIGMRVYEESAANKYTSTLIWCPNDHLYPNKHEASFAMGQGDSNLEATENAAQLASFNLQYFTVQCNSAANGTVYTEPPSEFVEDEQLKSKLLPSVITTKNNVTDASSTEHDQSESIEIKPEADAISVANDEVVFES